ncbi:MAG: hypothetical protein WAT71_03725 [Ignavibacteria bacterium]
MKKNFLFYSICITILFLSTSVFSQSKIVTGMYNGEYQKYYKDKLILAYLPDSVNNIDFIHKVNNFIRKHNGSIDSVKSILQYSEIEITLYSYNTDAIDFLDIFKNSGLFEYVCLYGIIEPNMIKPED